MLTSRVPARCGDGYPVTIFYDNVMLCDYIFLTIKLQIKINLQTCALFLYRADTTYKARKELNLSNNLTSRKLFVLYSFLMEKLFREQWHKFHNFSSPFCTSNRSLGKYFKSFTNLSHIPPPPLNVFVNTNIA